jgi:predicted permease
MNDLWLRLRAIFVRGRVERELDEELEFHIDMQTRKLAASGMPKKEARRRARVEFGAEALVKENCRDERRVNWIETLWQDARYALRGFRRTPAFALTVIATVALGLGINTAVFTLFNAYVLRPLAVRDPYSLYELYWLNRTGSHSLSAQQYEQESRDHAAFTETFATRNLELRVEGRVTYGELVSGNYFRTLGVGAALGRTLVPDDDAAPGREPVMMLSYDAWQSRFGGDPEILGRKIVVHGFPLTVVGVAPRGFTGINEMAEDFWAPLAMIAELDPDRGVRLRVFGRLRPEMSVRQANAVLAVEARRMTADLAEAQRATSAVLRSRVTAVPLSPQGVRMMTPVIAAFGMVLLIACANVANMMLARAMARQREIGIRLSLGAGRGRLIRQLLTESVLLALPAAAAGFAISQATIAAGVRAIFATLPAEFAEYLRLVPMPPDARVFAFMMAAALVSAVMFGLAPALQATRAAVIQAARGDFTNEHRPARLRNALVIVQITGCVMLLICAGVLLRGAQRVRAIDNGLDTSHAIEIETLEKARPRVVAHLQADPLVESVAASFEAPLDSAFPSIQASAAGESYSVPAGLDSVSPEFFTVFAIPIVQGRNFTGEEASAAAPAAIITQTLARRMFSGRNPIGQTVRIAGARRRIPDARVIGVARDINTFLSDGDVERSTIFLPTTTAGAGNVFVIRVHGDAEAARRKIDAALSAEAPGAVDQIHRMDMFVVGRVYPFRVAYWISAIIGMLALTLAMTGIYGVLSYLVMQRRKEIGIRMALGASARQVVALVLRQSLRLALIGLAVGAVLALGASRIYSSTFDKSGIMNTFDGLAYGGGLALVFMACLLAGYFPSRRAAHIDPADTLRCD